MRCSDIQKDLELYDLLGARARARVDAHIAACAECSALFESIQRTQALIRKAAEVRPEPDDALHLTTSIMHRIEHERDKQRNTPWLSLLITRLQMQPLRYAYGVVSLLLIGSFVYESTRPMQMSAALVVPVASATSEVHLNTTAFLENLRRLRKESKTKTFLGCIQACQTADGGIECTDCKKLYTKFYSKL